MSAELARRRMPILAGGPSARQATGAADVEREGPVIGSLNGQPIAATVVDRDGHAYVFTGLAPRHRDGRLDVEALKPNEWIVRPGLVYQLEGSTVFP